MFKTFMIGFAVVFCANAYAGESYCTPEAVKKAYIEYQQRLERMQEGRAVSDYGSALAGGRAVEDNRLYWESERRHAYDMTVGMQQALCKAEMQQRR